MVYYFGYRVSEDNLIVIFGQVTYPRLKNNSDRDT